MAYVVQKSVSFLVVNPGAKIRCRFECFFRCKFRYILCAEKLGADFGAFFSGILGVKMSVLFTCDGKERMCGHEDSFGLFVSRFYFRPKFLYTNARCTSIGSVHVLCDLRGLL